MHVSEIPGVRVVWALWRVLERRARRERLSPVIEQFQLDELIPLKGFTFRVAHKGPHGIVLAPVGFTAHMRKRLAAQAAARAKEAARVGRPHAL